MGSSGTRRAQNELLFRAVNERVKDLNEAFESVSGEASGFICECDDLDCSEQIPISVAEYERIRAAPRHFVVKPGHEAGLRLERVVERFPDHLVVEKSEEDLPADDGG